MDLSVIFFEVPTQIFKYLNKNPKVNVIIMLKI